MNTVEIKSAGERDPDADDVSGMSASKMRKAVQEKDMPAFLSGLPKNFVSRKKSMVTELFKAVMEGME